MKLASSFIAAAILGAAACASHQQTNKSTTPVAEATPAKLDIVETANSTGSFNTLLAALKAADLTATLKGDGPFTVFAPTDAAFAKLPAGTVEDLLKEENKEKLRAVLTYHVVSGRVGSNEVVKLASSKTLQGEEVTFSQVEGGVQVNSATVTQADVDCSNGVVHVIDTVLLPK